MNHELLTGLVKEEHANVSMALGRTQMRARHFRLSRPTRNKSYGITYGNDASAISPKVGNYSSILTKLLGVRFMHRLHHSSAFRVDVVARHITRRALKFSR